MAKEKVRAWRAEWNWRTKHGRLEYLFENGRTGGIAAVPQETLKSILALFPPVVDSFVDQSTQTVFAQGGDQQDFQVDGDLPQFSE